MNPYARAAAIASSLGSREATEVFGAGARAQQVATRLGHQSERAASVLTTGGRTAQRGQAPRTRGSNSPALGGIQQRGRNTPLGATTVHRRPRQQPYADVQGMPRVRMVEEDDHSITITITLTSRYARWMNEGDLAELRRHAAIMERDMRRLSRGRLRPKQLRKMNHPYGYGLYAPSITYKDAKGRTRIITRRRRKLPKTLAPKKFRQLGVTSMEVINRNTGELERSWESGAHLTNTGAVIVIRNTAPYAAALAMGTPLMKAHGPWTAVIVLHRQRTVMVWRGISYRAWRRSDA